MVLLPKVGVICRFAHRGPLAVVTPQRSTIQILPTEKMGGKDYNPSQVEKNKYLEWDKKNLFKAKSFCPKPIFSMVLPPPNVCGNLDLNHALSYTAQDVVVRYKRATGYNVLWLPGTEHGSGTDIQDILGKLLLKNKPDDANSESTEKHRQNFLHEMWKWKAAQSANICKICSQLRTLGCSLDWSRQAFTLNDKYASAVNTAFFMLSEKGLIHRKLAIRNWCNTLKSTVTDNEIERLELNGPTDIMVPGYDQPITFGRVYYLSYKIKDTDEEIIVCTTMPETMLGDTAIAVNPRDNRYCHLTARSVIHPLRNTEIPIIFDKAVNMGFGTGALRITPAHSTNDYEIAQAHEIPLLQVIGEDGCMVNAGKYNNMKLYECRQAILNDLRQMGLLRKVLEPRKNLDLYMCRHTGDIIYQLPKEQWFLNGNSLIDSARKLVHGGNLTIMPERYMDDWLKLTEEDNDWCISRQLWWGHQIPAYKCTKKDKEIWITATDEKIALKLASETMEVPSQEISVEQDTDVLDTWFLSSIYPLAVLGWPECTPDSDFASFYPIDLLMTRKNLLPTWVYRMAIIGLELTGRPAFEKLLLHGEVVDSKGNRESKSVGNVVEPMDVINGISLRSLTNKTKHMHKHDLLTKHELQKALDYQTQQFYNTRGIPQCGADALRFTLLSHDIKSNLIKFDIAECYENRKFCDDIWKSVNHAQFCFDKLNTFDTSHLKRVSKVDLTYFDKWIISKLADMVETVNKAIENHNFHIATATMKSFISSDVMDIYFKITKKAFEGKDAQVAFAHAHTLSAVLNTSLRCLAPFMIFLTEELIPKIPRFKHSAIRDFDDTSQTYCFPQYKHFSDWRNDKLEKEVETFFSIVKDTREVTKEVHSVSDRVKPIVYVNSTNEIVITNKEYILDLTKGAEVKFEDAPSKNINKKCVGEDTELIIELKGEKATDEDMFLAKDKLVKLQGISSS